MAPLSTRRLAAARLAAAAGILLLVVCGVAGADPAFTSAHAVPGLAALNADGTATIDDLSCSSNGNCGAIGTYLDGSRLTQGFVVNETNDVWGAAEEIPGLGALNAAGAVGAQLAISCPATGECAAAGYYTDASQIHQTFVVDETNGTWGSAGELTRSGLLPVDLPAVPAELACASAGNCVVGGTYLDGTQQATQSWVATETGGTWSAAVPLPGTLNQGALGGLVSLACPAVGTCTAAGFYTDSSNRIQGYVDDEADGTWGAAQPVPGLAAMNTGGAASPLQVACSSPGNCAIGGEYTLVGGAGEAFVANEVDGAWASAQEAPGSAALNAGGDASINSVACPANGSCEAVGYYSPTTSSSSDAMVMSESGGVWGSATEMPGTAQLNTNVFATAYSVSCVTAGDCRAVGLYTDSSNNSQAFIATETGGAWTGSVEAPGSASLNVEGVAELDVVSCTSDGACSAGGEYKDGAGSSQVMIIDASTPPPTAPDAPAVQATSHAKGKVAVTVIPAGDGGDPITAYQYSTNDGAWRLGSSGATTFVLTRLKSGSRVHLRVRAVNAVGPSSPSPTVVVKVR